MSGAGPTFSKVSGGTTLGVLREADLSSTTGNDWAIVTCTNPDVNPFGTVWVNGTALSVTETLLRTRDTENARRLPCPEEPGTASAKATSDVQPVQAASC